MPGKVKNWTWDAYEEDYYPRSPEVDPVGPLQSAFRVARGGSWLSDPDNCRPASRGWFTPECRAVDLSFRVAGVM